MKHMDLKRKRAGSKDLPDSPIVRTSYLPDDPEQCKQLDIVLALPLLWVLWLDYVAEGV